MAKPDRVSVRAVGDTKVVGRVTLAQPAQRVVAGPAEVVPRALVEDFRDPTDVVRTRTPKDRRPGYRAPGISVDSGWRPE
jgi:hypothetical protein